ncbi:MAG: hypothetical protein KFF73_03475, partial [Cyclobacteriaceae bacterium]|nr:hypothetical protein [Cyclobacteriaceae bacterium]
EGAYSLAGEILWTGNSSFVLTDSNHKQAIRKALKKTEIDGMEDNEWQENEEYAVTASNHPNTDPDLKAYWKSSYDDEFLYFFVRVMDRTNLQGRKVEINLQGTPFNRFRAIRSTDEKETARSQGIVEAENGKITYEVPPRSVTTFTGIR